jgi:hypothetical protein
MQKVPRSSEQNVLVFKMVYLFVYLFKKLLEDLKTRQVAKYNVIWKRQFFNFFLLDIIN